jgi:hypothetical protein
LTGALFVALLGMGTANIAIFLAFGEPVVVYPLLLLVAGTAAIFLAAAAYVSGASGDHAAATRAESRLDRDYPDLARDLEGDFGDLLRRRGIAEPGR